MPALTTSWKSTSFAIVAIITAFRLVGLYFAKADLFVDEAQYWFWGQNLDFGYYSKPPLIGWVIRAFTELANSSSAFWIRFPAPVFHGITALILAVWARRQFDAAAAIWVATIYVTLPIVAVGSTLISTDTIMAPFLALGLLFYRELLFSGKMQHALLTGLSIGLAIMAKYAGAYFLLGAVLSAVFIKSTRISLVNSGVLVGVLALVISPNVIWNLQHDLTTIEHTLDNVDWVRGTSTGTSLSFGRLSEFLLSQFVAMGPIIFAVFLYLCWRVPANMGGLVLFSLPVIALVCVQALLSEAFANWAFAAFLPAILLVVPWLAHERRFWLWAGLAVNAVVAVALPVLVVLADFVRLDGQNLLLVRYIGRDELSSQILDVAGENGSIPVVSNNRDVLADLFWTGRDLDIQVFSVAGDGRARHYYQQNYPFVSDGNTDVLFVTGPRDMICGDVLMKPWVTFDIEGTAYAGSGLRAYKMPPVCHHLIR